MTFSEPLILLAGPAILLLVVLASVRLTARRRRLAEFLGGRRAAARLGRSGLHRIAVGRTVLLGLVALLLAAAAAGPEWMAGAEEATPTPSDPPPPSLVLAVDISASMQARDGNPTRLARAAEVARDFRATVEHGRVGLLLFSGTPYLLAPPTRDHHVLEYLLDGITPELVNIYDPGSLPSAALREATRALTNVSADSSDAADPGGPAPDPGGTVADPADSDGSERPPTSGSSPPTGRRTIVLIGDGGAGEPVTAIREAATEAAEEGIRIHTVAVGTSEGGRMLLPAGYTPKGSAGTDPRDPMVTRLDAAVLREIADVGGGISAHAEDAAELDRIRRVLAAPAREPAPETRGPLWTRFDPATVLVALALLALLVEGLLAVPLRPTRRVQPWSAASLGTPAGAARRAARRPS